MTHNKPITQSPALPILVDCRPKEKGDGLATWASDPNPRAIKLFTKQDAETFRKTKRADRFEKVGRLLGAIARKDGVEVGKSRKGLIATIDTENAAMGKYDISKDHKHYMGWKTLMAGLGVNPDGKRRYGRRDRRKKLYSFFGTQIFSVLELEEPVYSPPRVGKKGSKEREQRKLYDKEFKRRRRLQERKLDEIMASDRLAPSLENEITLSQWQLSSLLSEARLVIWHSKKSFQPALYCGGNLDVAHWAYTFTKNFYHVSSNQGLCHYCGEPFVVTRAGKKYCCSSHQASAAMRRMRERRKRKQAHH